MLRIKHLLLGAAIGLLALLASPASVAQTVSVPATLRVSWIPPTATDSGLPLTGALALTGYEVYISSSPIADDTTAAPTLTLAGTATTTTQTLTVPNGSTLYVRLRAVRNAEKSALSAQATAPVNVSTKPGAPTSVEIQLTISVP